MLSTGRQSASDDNETDPNPRQFHNWKGNKGAAEILLPDVEDPCVHENTGNRIFFR